MTPSDERATNCSRMATLVQSGVTLGSELRKERPAVRRRARSLAGLRAMMAVADSLVEYQDQRGHRVLDGRPAELGLPLVDRAVDQACGDHPVRKMTERRNDAKSGAGGRARSRHRLGEFGKSYLRLEPRRRTACVRRGRTANIKRLGSCALPV